MMRVVLIVRVRINGETERPLWQTTSFGRTKESSDLFKRQISAGPAFNLTPTQLSPTRVPTSQHAMARPPEMTHLVGRTKSSPSDHARALMTQSAIRGQFNEAVVLDDPDTMDLFDSPARLACPRPMVSISPEHAPRYFADPRFVASDQHHRTSLDRGHANRLHESFELSRDSGASYPSSTSSMTQSVFFPSDSAWMASGHHAYDGGQSSTTASTAASASGRRRRVRQGVMRSHSQRAAELFDPRFMGGGTVPEPQGFAFSPAFYQRSISHTVPLEAMGPDMAWPPVLAQWHHRRPVAGDPNLFTSQPLDAGVVRKERILCGGRSSNDLIHVNRTKHGHPQHHHSASAIYECLEEQP
ncbi:unnamed protein product [Echinostoma caproni]|uniref:Uncharacterized protein n=1 Tax=Echinostoma caproni TaxID=27848 RepID=A0A183B2G4_9TREM|nr:unnamed protein product [Echinostoma caproni]